MEIANLSMLSWTSKATIFMEKHMQFTPINHNINTT